MKINQSSYYIRLFTSYKISYQLLSINIDQYCQTQETQIGKIENTFFTGYCLHIIENSRTSTLDTYFAGYCFQLTENSRTSARYNSE